MATCPHCGGFLDEHHRCSGLWRLRARVIATRFVGAAIGGVVGLVVAPHSWAAFVVAAILGLVIAEAVQRGN